MSTITPLERRARARAIAEARRNNILYNRYSRSGHTTLANNIPSNNVAEVEEEKEDKNFFLRGLETVGDFFGNVVGGAVKGVEGIVDFGAGIVGAVGGIFDDGFQDDVKSFIERDYAGKYVSNPINEFFDDSYMRDGGITEQVANAIGQMLPAVAVSVATAGAGAPAAFSQAASLTTTAVSAAGTGTESAYKDGAGYYRGLGYGTTQGLVEAGTEKLFGGPTKNLFGKGALDNVGKEIADTGIKRIAKQALQEGAEEMIAEVANPALKSIYKGKDAFKEYGSGDYWLGVGQAGAVGTLTGVAYSGTVGYGISKATGQPTGKAADINDSLTAIKNQKKKRDRLWTDKKNTPENEARIAENIKGNYKNIENILKKSSEAKRAKLIKDFSLESAFEADGTMKANFAASFDFNAQGVELNEQTPENVNSAKTSLDKRYVSPDLQGKSEKIGNDLGRVTEDLRKKYAESEKISAEEAAEIIKDVQTYNGELSDNADKNYTKLKKGLNYLNNLSGHSVQLVVTEAHDSFNGTLLGDTMYISADTLNNGEWAKTLIHEYTHFSEGTAEYQKLMDALTGDTKLAQKTLSELFDKSGYGFDKIKTEQILDKYGKLANSETPATDIDSREEIRYNRKTKYISYDKIGPDAVNHIRSELRSLYQGLDGCVADGIAIEREGYVYIVDSGKENGKIDFGIRRRRKISDKNVLYEFIRSQNNDAISKGYVSDELSSRLGDGRSSDSGRDMRRESGAKLQADNGKSEDNQSRVFGENEDNRGLNSHKNSSGEIKYNLKDNFVEGIEGSQEADADTISTELENEVAEELTEEELEYISEYKSELGAHLTANLLGTESFIDRITRENTTIAEKILNKISDLKERFARRGNPEAIAEYKKIKKAEKLYLDAVEKAGYAYVGRKIVGANSEREEETKFSYKGRAKDGKGIYESNFPQGTPKSAKSERILDYITNVWSKKPINLVISNGEQSRVIAAQFDPTVDSSKNTSTDASKLAGGNRHGNHTEQRVTLDLADDYYQIASEAVYNYSKEETGKDSSTHEGVKTWHYFVNDIYFSEYGQSELTPYTVTINVKEKNDGSFVYSFNAEKTKEFTTRQTLHAAVNTRKGANGELYIDSISENSEKINTFSKKTSEDIKFNLKSRDKEPKSAGDYSYTENQYTRFGWARHSEVLTQNELDDLYSKIQEKISLGSFKQSSKGEAIIEVNNQPHTTLDVDNVFVFVKGGKSNFEITRVVRFDAQTETEMDIIREHVYEGRTCSDTYIELYKKEGVAREYRRKDSPTFTSYREGRSNGETSRGTNQDNRGREKYRSGYSLSVGEDGEIREKVKFNLKPNDKVAKSIGEYQKFKANYTKEKVYTKKEISDKLLSVPYISTLPKAMQNEIIDSAWLSLNTIESDTSRDFFIQGSYHRILQKLWQNSEEFQKLTSEEMHEVELKLQKTVRDLAKIGGSPSQLSKIEAQYAKTEAGKWRAKYKEAVKWNEYIGNLMSKARRMRDIKRGTYSNVSQYKQELFRGSIEKLSRVEFRGNLNVTGTRKIIKSLSEWYSPENPIFKAPEGSTKKTSELYDEYVADTLNAIANGDGAFSISELSALNDVMGYFIHFIENFGKIKRNGEYVEARPIAEKFVEILRSNKSDGNVGFWHKFVRGFMKRYGATFFDNESVVRYMDGYEDGFYTEIFQKLREGAIESQLAIHEIEAPLRVFYKKHKKFLNEIRTHTVEYRGNKVPAVNGMLLYMTLKREQALMALAKSGFSYAEAKSGEKTHLGGFAVSDQIELSEIENRATELRDKLYKQFTADEKEYIAIAERIFNKDCKERKEHTDIERRGYSNVIEGFYVPVHTANVAHSVDNTFFDEISRVSNASFNKNTVEGAKGELFIGELDTVLHRHIKGVALYSSLAETIDEYNYLFNLDIGGNPNKPVSVKVAGENVWAEGDKFFRKLISDIQGIPSDSALDFPILAAMRGAYAKYQLGANPKVWLTQLSSFAAASSVLDVDSIIKSIGVVGKDVDKYCALAKLRNEDNTAAKAQGVMDKVDKVGNVLMWPIGKFDRIVIRKLFSACQVQVQKNNGLKIGTEENKIKAGELLKEVIIKTQQNSIATERSAAMRSGNEILKAATMFSADSMKVLGRVIDAYGELLHLKKKRKNTTEPAERTELDKKIKAAKKKARKSTAALVTSAIMMALVAWLFRLAYNKDEGIEEELQNVTVDAFGNMLGGMPILRDVYSKLMEGYDVDNYAYAGFNDLLETATAIRDIAAQAIDGKTDSRDVALMLRKLAYSVGQVTGIPTRNLYNVITGVTRRFSPSTAYSIDDKFYKQSYRKDLADAIEREDEDMIAMIAGLMLDENIGGIDDSDARASLNELLSAGFDVLPRSTPEKITYEGEEITLTAREQKSFKNIYSTANEALGKLVKLSQYKSATDEAKADAVKYIYNVYYNLAVEDALGVELENKNVLFAEAIDVELLAVIYAEAKRIGADKDKNGNAISGSRKRKLQAYVNSLRLTAAQKYMIMGYLGYKNINGEAQVKALIRRLKLSKEEQQQLLGYSGYAA